MIRKWVRLEYACGPEVLKQKNRHKEWSAEERYELVAKVLAGKSIKSVAFSVAIDDGMLSSVLTNTKQRGKNHPTRVGTRKSTKAHPRKLEEHPHACGDKFFRQGGKALHHRSSPRVWGQVVGVVVAAQREGIIPTRMGTSNMDTSTIVQIVDHPHAYGDKKMNEIMPKYNEGSSPRVWGQDCIYSPRMERHRIIPTRVGTSCALNQSMFFP